MDVIAIILALTACHYLPATRDWTLDDTFRRYADWLQRRLNLADDWNDTLPVLLLLVPPVLLTGLLQLLLGSRLGGIPGLLFGVLVLLFCLPGLRADQMLSRVIKAMEQGREDDARQLVESQLTPADDEAPPARVADRASRQALSEGAPDLLALAFWFIVVGPLGAVAWRLADRARWLADRHEHGGQALRVWHHWLGWLPSRLLMLGYGLMGNLQIVIGTWRELGPYVSNHQLLDRAGHAALNLAANATDPKRLAAVRQLIRRALLLLLAGLMVLKLIIPI